MLNPANIRAQIDGLLAAYPELAEDDILRTDMIEGATDAFDFLGQIVRRLEESAILRDGAAARVSELRERIGRYDRREEGLRSLAFKVMEAANLKKAELPTATLSIRAGTPKVVITDEAILPDYLCRIKREPDKAKIKDLLANNQPISGAQLSNAEPTLAIRVK